MATLYAVNRILQRGARLIRAALAAGNDGGGWRYGAVGTARRKDDAPQTTREGGGRHDERRVSKTAAHHVAARSSAPGRCSRKAKVTTATCHPPLCSKMLPSMIPP